jgi:hypothetical protein
MSPHYERITTHQDGRFRIEGIVPGMKCVLSASTKKGFLKFGEEFKGLTLRSGETRELGVIPSKPYAPE